MKDKIHVGVLAAEALVCVLFCILQTSFVGVFTTAMAFPFEQIGLALRLLSLSGVMGNALAVVLYTAICLSPLAVLLILQRKRKLYMEDGLLVLLSAVLFAVIYLMINPGFISSLNAGSVGQSIGKAVLGGTFYSVLVGYVILRVLRLFYDGVTNKLASYMSVMLVLLNILFVYLIFGAYFSALLGSISTLRAGNIGNEHLLGTTYVFLALQFIVNSLPYVFSILIIFAALRLLSEMRKDRFSDKTVAAAEWTSRICATALVATILASISFNLLQLLLVKSLFIINTSVQIPVFSIIFVLATLLFTRLITENKMLKDDNDLFV